MNRKSFAPFGSQAWFSRLLGEPAQFQVANAVALPDMCETAAALASIALPGPTIICWPTIALGYDPFAAICE